MMNSSSSSRCAACKHLRRRCPSDCIFSPYFPSNNPTRFACVHKVYGASNVGKILQDVAVDLRAEAAESVYYSAYWRIKEPVYGCVGKVSILQQQIHDARCELARIRAQIALHQSSSSTVGLQQQQQQIEQHGFHENVVGPAAPLTPPNLLPLTSFYDDDHHHLSSWLD